MNKYIFVANINNVLTVNSRNSYKHAAGRWGAKFVEFLGPRRNQIDDKFAGLDQFEEDDMLLIADADILYRIDCPNLFDFGTDFGISACTDVQRTMNFYDTWGSPTEEAIKHWSHKRGINPANVFPMNTGVLIATVKTFKKVVPLYTEICDEIDWEFNLMPQAVFPIVCEELQVPVTKMPDWANYLNFLVKRGDRFVDEDEMMDSYSLHMAGYGEQYKNHCLNSFNWTKVPEV